MKPANAIAGLIAFVSLAGAGRSQTVYRAQTEAVVVAAAVTDGRKPVTHLTRDDFEVRDNGVVQEIADFSREMLPLDVTLTIDVSGSMKPSDRMVIERAIARVGSVLDARDRTSVVTFGTHVAERMPLRHPPIAADISGIGQGSAVLDALLLSLITPPVNERRQLVLFMTDGDDASSFFDGRTVIETAKHASATTSIVLVPNRASRQILGVLQGVASITGGEMIELERNDQLSQSFLAAIENVRQSYVIRYSPAGVKPGGWHDLSVTLKSPGYRVWARQGYWQ